MNLSAVWIKLIRYLKVAQILELKCFHHTHKKKKREREREGEEWSPGIRSCLLRAGTLERFPLVETEPVTERGWEKVSFFTSCTPVSCKCSDLQNFFRSHLVGAGEIWFSSILCNTDYIKRKGRGWIWAETGTT